MPESKAPENKKEAPPRTPTAFEKWASESPWFLIILIGGPFMIAGILVIWLWVDILFFKK